MKVKWLGHASFLVTSSQGTRVITDPYATSDRLVYGNISESANVVTVSHEHGDHNNTGAVGGNPQVVRGPGSYTVDATAASQVVQQLNPKVVIPLQIKNERCLFPIAKVEDFLQGKPQVRRIDGSEVELRAGQLPATTEIVVLKPAL